MQELIQPILNYLKPETIIQAGYVLMTIVVFTETGLLIGFCLPGDSLLVTAGFFAATGHLSLWKLNALLIPAAIIGDTVGYWIGLKTGPHIFNRKKSLVFNPEHLKAAHDFYERHGGKTIVLARFMPIVRTFAPLVAGMGRMNYRHFLAYNIVGGVGWVLSMTLIGYFFGQIVPAKKLEYIIVAVIVISVLPAAIPVVKNWLKARRKPKIDDEADAGLAVSSVD
ncbi:MAG TPA: VTT domain-containing protein [Isosphaeraceae bacterium]